MTKKKAARPAGSVLRCFKKRPDDETKSSADMQRRLKLLANNFEFEQEEDEETLSSLFTDCAFPKKTPSDSGVLYLLSTFPSQSASVGSGLIAKFCANLIKKDSSPLIALSIDDFKNVDDDSKYDTVCCCFINTDNYKEMIKECVESNYFCIIYCMVIDDQLKQQCIHEVERLGRIPKLISLRGMHRNMEEMEYMLDTFC